MDEDEFLPLSGIQHFIFCERQCALIHVEGVFRENHLTLEGRLWHGPNDDPRRRLRDDIEVETTVWLRSERLGLVGLADRVEIHPGEAGRQLVPVEYKRSRRRSVDADSVQLCAQAMALEEMRGKPVRRGVLYYIKARRRLEVEFTDSLRRRTLEAAVAYHELIRSAHVPPAHYDRRCPTCSLRGVCLPMATENRSRVAAYLAQIIAGGA